MWSNRSTLKIWKKVAIRHFGGNKIYHRASNVSDAVIALDNAVKEKEAAAAYESKRKDSQKAKDQYLSALRKVININANHDKQECMR
jgi:hypothetical protein